LEEPAPVTVNFARNKQDIKNDLISIEQDFDASYKSPSPQVDSKISSPVSEQSMNYVEHLP
jgi:hypothetical protein